MGIKRKGERRNALAIEAAFPAAYIAHGMNGTKAYKSLRPYVTDETARATAPLILAKDSVKKSIAELLPHDGVETALIREALSPERRTKELISYKDAYKYAELSLKLKGYLDNDNKRGTVNIAIVQN